MHVYPAQQLPGFFFNTNVGPTILAVMRATKEIADWSIFALLLKLSPAEFKNIESATRDKQEQQKNIIIKWLNSGTASWAVLVNALNDELVKNGAIANEIAKKYPKSKYIFSQLTHCFIYLYNTDLIN